METSMMKEKSHMDRLPRSAFRRAMIILLAPLALAACGKVDRLATTDSVIPDALEQRHPIVLADAPYTIDVFPVGGRLDHSDDSRVADFISKYRDVGHGPITIMLPNGSPGSAVSVNAVRSRLAAAGIGGHVRVGHYAIQDRSMAAAVRLSFIGLKSKVATKCGEWPDDLASASSLHTWQNKPYWNMGCAYQNMLAVQVANPRDIASPRGESPADVRMRMRAITSVRRGADPGTNWKVQNSNIGSVGGN
jgi:pilus assembly protein CpaD